MPPPGMFDDLVTPTPAPPQPGMFDDLVGPAPLPDQSAFTATTADMPAYERLPLRALVTPGNVLLNTGESLGAGVASGARAVVRDVGEGVANAGYTAQSPGIESLGQAMQPQTHLADAANWLNDRSAKGRADVVAQTPPVVGAGLNLVGDIAPWMNPITAPIAAVSVGGHAADHAEQLGLSPSQALAAGVASGASAYAVPTLAGKVSAAPLSRALAPYVGDLASDTIAGATHGAGTGVAQSVADAAVQAPYDPEGAKESLEGAGWNALGFGALSAAHGAHAGAVGRADAAAEQTRQDAVLQARLAQLDDDERVAKLAEQPAPNVNPPEITPDHIPGETPGEIAPPVAPIVSPDQKVMPESGLGMPDHGPDVPQDSAPLPHDSPLAESPTSIPAEPANTHLPESVNTNPEVSHANPEQVPEKGPGPSEAADHVQGQADLGAKQVGEEGLTNGAPPAPAPRESISPPKVPGEAHPAPPENERSESGIPGGAGDGRPNNDRADGGAGKPGLGLNPVRHPEYAHRSSTNEGRAAEGDVLAAHKANHVPLTHESVKRDNMDRSPDEVRDMIHEHDRNARGYSSSADSLAAKHHLEKAINADPGGAETMAMDAADRRNRTRMAQAFSALQDEHQSPAERGFVGVNREVTGKALRETGRDIAKEDARNAEIESLRRQLKNATKAKPLRAPKPGRSAPEVFAKRKAFQAKAKDLWADVRKSWAEGGKADPERHSLNSGIEIGNILAAKILNATPALIRVAAHYIQAGLHYKDYIVDSARNLPEFRYEESGHKAMRDAWKTAGGTDPGAVTERSIIAADHRAHLEARAEAERKRAVTLTEGIRKENAATKDMTDDQLQNFVNGEIQRKEMPDALKATMADSKQRLKEAEAEQKELLSRADAPKDAAEELQRRIDDEKKFQDKLTQAVESRRQRWATMRPEELRAEIEANAKKDTTAPEIEAVRTEALRRRKDARDEIASLDVTEGDHGGEHGAELPPAMAEAERQAKLTAKAQETADKLNGMSRTELIQHAMDSQALESPEERAAREAGEKARGAITKPENAGKLATLEKPPAMAEAERQAKLTEAKADRLAKLSKMSRDELIKQAMEVTDPGVDAVKEAGADARKAMGPEGIPAKPQGPAESPEAIKAKAKATAEFRDALRNALTPAMEDPKAKAIRAKLKAKMQEAFDADKTTEARRAKLAAGMKARNFDTSDPNAAWLHDPNMHPLAMKALEAAGASGLDRFLELKTAIMHMSAKVVGKKGVGDSVRQAYEVASRIMSATLNEAAMKLGLGSVHGATFAEVRHMLAGLWAAASGPMWHAFNSTLRTGISAYEMSRRVEGKPVEMQHNPFHANTGVRGKIVTASYRLIHAMQASWSVFTAAGEVAAQAYRTAVRDGRRLTGEALAEHIRDEIANPESESWKRAHDYAERSTFTAPNMAAEALNKAGSVSPLARAGIKWFVPFAKIPFNFFKYNFDIGTLHIPAMLAHAWKGQYKGAEGSGALIDDIGRAAIYTGLMATSYGLVNQKNKDGSNFITGIATEPDWDKKGTVTIDGIRFKYIAIPGGLALAAWLDGLRMTGGKKADLQHVLVAPLAAEPLAQTLSDLNALATGDGDATERWKKFAADQVTSFIPPAVKQVFAAARDTAPQPATGFVGHAVQDVFANGPPKVDAFGRDVTKDGTGGPIGTFLYRLFSPAQMGNAIPYDIKATIADKAPDIAIMAWNESHPDNPIEPKAPDLAVKLATGPVTVTPEQRDEALRAGGANALAYTKAWLTASGMDPLNPTEDYRKAVTAAFSRYHGEAMRQEARGVHPEVDTAMAEAQAQRDVEVAGIKAPLRALRAMGSEARSAARDAAGMR